MTVEDHADARRAALHFWWGVLLVMLAVSAAGNAAHTYLGAPTGLEVCAGIVGGMMPVALATILMGIEKGWAARINHWKQAPALVIAVVLAGIVFWYSYKGLVWVVDWLQLTDDPHLRYAVAAVPDLLMSVATWFVMVLRNPDHVRVRSSAPSPWKRMRSTIAEGMADSVEARAAQRRAAAMAAQEVQVVPTPPVAVPIAPPVIETPAPVAPPAPAPTPSPTPTAVESPAPAPVIPQPAAVVSPAPVPTTDSAPSVPVTDEHLDTAAEVVRRGATAKPVGEVAQVIALLDSGLPIRDIADRTPLGKTAVGDVKRTVEMVRRMRPPLSVVG